MVGCIAHIIIIVVVIIIIIIIVVETMRSVPYISLSRAYGSISEDSYINIPGRKAGRH